MPVVLCVENSTVDGIRRGPAAWQRAAGRPLSGTTGSVTGPRLGRGRVGFDSPVPDVWGCACHGEFGYRIGRRVLSPERRVRLPYSLPCRRGVHGDMPAFQAGVAGSTPV